MSSNRPSTGKNQKDRWVQGNNELILCRPVGAGAGLRARLPVHCGLPHPGAAIGALANLALPGLARALFGNRVVGQASGFALVTLPVVLYFALLESSAWQASWGKRWRGLRVVDARGARLSWGRALGRTALAFIP